MKLWTYHDNRFDINKPGLQIDLTKGNYWKMQAYREALPALHKLLDDETNFLWFCTTWPNEFTRTNREPNRIEWEIEIDPLAVFKFIDVDIWKRVLRANGRELPPALIAPGVPPNLARYDALVKLPLPPGCTPRNRPVPTTT